MPELEQKSPEIPPWFIDDVTRLFAMYPHARMTPATPIAWWGCLGSLKREELRQAVSIAVEESPGFIPSAPTILCKAKVARSDPGRKLAAWGQILIQARNSRCASVSDPVAAEVVQQMGGFRRLGDMSEEDLSIWGRKQFDSLWNEIEQRDELRKRLGYDDGKAKLTDGNGDARLVFKSLAKGMDFENSEPGPRDWKVAASGDE